MPEDPAGHHPDRPDDAAEAAAAALDGVRRERRDRELGRLVADQEGMVARRQLNRLGIDWDAVDAHVRARRWAKRTPRVISTVTGSLTVPQLRWLALLHAGPQSMLGALTAAAHHGLRGWEREVVTVWVDDELAFEPVAGVRFFRTRRPFSLLLSERSGMRTARLEPSLLLWAAYEAEPRAAVGVLAAAVQQGRTTADRLAEWVELLRPLRRARLFRGALRDIAAGAQSAAELDVGRMCVLFSMPRPHRQTVRRDRGGRIRSTDCEWDLPDGSVVVLEVQGPAHMEVPAWTADMRRHRRITARSRVVVQCSSTELRDEPVEVALDLIALGVPGQLPGSAA